MGSSSTGKHKHKKEKKHKRHRSRSPKELRSGDEEQQIDLTSEQSNSRHRHHKHKKHKERHRDKQHKHRERDREEQTNEVIALAESDSDSSDCVEVPVDSKSNSNTETERSAPPPPLLTKNVDYEEERRRRAYEKERDREREREKEKERERDRERHKAYERAREKERERERYEKEREMERRRERDSRDDEMDREMRKDRERNRERERGYERSEREYHPRHRSEREEREFDSPRDAEKHNRDRERSSERDRPRERDFSPIPSNGAGDCLSIEETNKLRAKLGLKPLEVESGPSKPSTSAAAAEAKKPGEKDLSSYKDEWGEFLHKPAENLKEKAKAEKMREKLKQRKEKRFLEERLARIKTLGESDEEVDDTSKWVQRNKKVVDEKKAAEERAKALEEMDQEFGIDDLVEKEKDEARRKAYTEKHLRGLKVDHDMDEFSEGKTIILTLKDADVLDEKEGDTLINVNMLDDARFRKNVENKKKNPLAYGYNVYEEQYDELGNPIERNILEKYDEDLDGNKLKTKNFVIGENLDEVREHRRKLLEIKTKLAGKRLETLADTEITLASDTLTETEMAKFKKPKKKIKKLRQKLKADDLQPLEEDTTHFGSRRGRHRSISDENDPMDSEMNLKIEEQDDDLERVLSKARKLKQKENIIKKSLPNIESMQPEIKPEIEEDNDMDSDVNRDAHIILNATAEFCRTLGDIPTYGMAGNRDEDSNDMMDFETIENAEERLGDNTDDMIEASHGTWNSVNPDEVNQPADLDNIVDEVEEVAILDEEPDVGAGVANALRLALSKGYLEKEDLNRPSNSKMAHLQAKNYSIEDKNTAEDDKFGRRDRFQHGPIMDFKDKNNFNPNVKLEYIDDNGRILNLKEAFRYLSHKFHGKGPGKNKIEKRLKKMEQEGLMKTMSSTDTPLGTLTMLQQKQKETKTPYVVLSGGKQTTNNVAGSTISKFK
ncbi:U4/U6.U5 tri-snRNP-associated protein 1 [Calliphora vicina]|uniref:U4/U6.U5 tri-snRNP-associated protein 1 n=1 Tax=Calliphora vicina TaxID=7373 RepID=UPI00325A8839